MKPPSAPAIRLAVESDVRALGALHVTSWRESYPGLMPDALIGSHSAASRERQWRDILSQHGGPEGTAVLLADVAGRIAGFGSCGLQRSDALRQQGYAGEISALYVLAAYQGRGVGRRLMAAAAGDLRDRGVTTAALWVLRDNHPARRFYERLGGSPCGTREDPRGEHVLLEVAYGWSDLAAVGPVATGSPGYPRASRAPS